MKRKYYCVITDFDDGTREWKYFRRMRKALKYGDEQSQKLNVIQSYLTIVFKGGKNQCS